MVSKGNQAKGLGREFQCSLSLIMDKLFLKAIIHELYH